MKKENIKLDLNNNLVNLANSILKFYGCDTFHNSIPYIDEIFKNRKNKKICVLLYDGFGKIIFDTYKNDIPFLYSHVFKTFSSIYPPTTVAATNAFLTAKYPRENGFVGWNQYFKNVNKFVDVFLNKDSIKDEKIDNDVTIDFLKPKFIDQIINEKNNKKIATIIKSLSYKDQEKHDDFNKFFEIVNDSLKKYEFIYAYSTEPDHSLHETGIENEKIKNILKYLENKTKELVNNNPDTLFILIADHGFKDVEYIPLYEDKELIETLKDESKKAIFTIEPRFASFFVKDKEKFEEIYNKKYKKDFILMSKEELLNSEILGPKDKNINEYCNDTLGDFILLATSSFMFSNKENKDFKMKGTHAGVTKEELTLNIAIFNN